MTGLNEIETITKEFSDANDALTGLKKELNSEIEEVRSKYFKKIKSSIEKIIAAKTELEQSIISNKHLFEKPRTMVFSGVRIGFQKSKDKITWDDDGRLISLIEKKIDPLAAKILVKTEKKPVKDAISKLDESELRKIGCKIEKGADKVLIKTLDTEIDKFVGSLVKETEYNY